MDKAELTKALRVIKSYCTTRFDCEGCMIETECLSIKEGKVPECWKMKEDMA